MNRLPFILKFFFTFFIFITCFNSSSLGQLPSNLIGLQLWLSADSGVVLSGSNVSLWKDYSGKLNHARQITASDEPLLVSGISVLNNKPVISFDGVNDYFELDAALDIQSGFYVFKYSGGSVAGGYPVLLGCQDNPPKYVSLIENGTSYFRNTGETFFTDYYVNSAQTNQLAPLSAYKIIHGSNTVSSQTLTDAQVGTSKSFHPGAIFLGDLAEVIIYNRLLSAVERKQIEYYLNNKYAPPVNLGADVTVSYGFCPVKINAHKDWFTSYQWNGGQTTDSIFAISNSSVVVTNIFGFTSSDTMNITYLGNFSPFSDTTICYGDTLIWNTQLNKAGYDFLWQDASTDSILKITQSGAYYVKVTDTLGCNRYSDTITVTVDNFPQIVSLGPDTSYCSGANLALISGAGQVTSYVWSTGATTSSIVITSTGTYSATVKNANGCVANDVINVSVKGASPTIGFIGNAVCFGGATSFSDTSFVPLPDNISSWAWNFGDGNSSSVKNPVNTYTAAGTYTTTLTVVSDSGCKATTKKPITVYPKPNANFNFSSLSCAGGNTSFTDASSTSGGTLQIWSWNFGDPSSGNNTSTLKNPTHTFISSATYTVQLIVTNSFACKDTSERTITVFQPANALFNADSVCVGNTTTFVDKSTAPVVNWL